MEERIIAFLDVLGFSNDVKSSSKTKHLNRIEQILYKEANTLGHIKKLKEKVPGHSLKQPPNPLHKPLPQNQTTLEMNITTGLQIPSCIEVH